MQIPLRKLLGKKKTNPLLVVPRLDGSALYVEERLPVGPEPMSSEMGGDTAVVTVTPEAGEPDQGMGAIRWVQPGSSYDDGGWGGGAPGGHYENGDPNSPPVEQNPVENEPIGGGVSGETPEETRQRECQECYQAANNAFSDATRTWQRAQENRNLGLQAEDKGILDDIMSCFSAGTVAGGAASAIVGWLGAGGGPLTWAGVSAFASTPIGWISMSTAALIVGGVAAKACYDYKEGSRAQKRAEIELNFSKEAAAFNSAIRDYEAKKSACASKCN